ncbi:hypothetical protein [Mycobacterium kansasii]|uniref:hypothetical protein n=1 Tax=Mycobacterium kansasii TaxID=1768 RepID=UPI001CE38F75|nr:hypothetical protein [Mycobacterium kansasii]UCA22852.1 hypothetical protein LA359_28405 [Mycobacterium kansasii]
MSGHKQVKASRATVDEGIVDLLEALWAEGLGTQFSCQGGGLPGGRPAPASITFSTVDDALRFMRETMERSYWYNRLTMQLAEPIEDCGPVRAHIQWPAIDSYTGDCVTTALTDVWSGQQRPDDLFTRRARG